MGSARASTIRARWMLAAVAFVLVAAFPYFERLHNANERPRLLQGMAWIEGEGAAIDGPATRHIDPGIDVSTTVDGRLVPNKPPGTTVPAAAAYALLRATASAEHPPSLRRYTWLARLLGAWLPTIVLVLLAWRRHRGLLGPSLAASAVALYALATPAATYAHVLFGHSLAALCLWWGLVTLVDAGVTDPHASFDRQRAVACSLGGASLAAAIVVEYQSAFAVLPVAILMLLELRTAAGRRRALAAASGALPLLAALATYHAVLFGSPLSTGYHHVVDPGFAAKHAVGFLGLHRPSWTALYEHLVSPWGGLLYWAPILVLAAVGVAPLLRALEPRLRREVVLMLCSFATLLLVNLSLAQTGGWRVGPRYLVSAFPLLILPLGLCLREHGHRPLLTCAWVAAITWSVSTNTLAANLFPHLVPEGSPVGDILVPLWRRGLEPWSIVHLVGLQRGGLWLVGLVTAAVSVAALHAFVGPDRRCRVAALAGISLGCLALLATALTSPSSSLAEQDLAAIAGIWEPTSRPAPSRPLW